MQIEETGFKKYFNYDGAYSLAEMISNTYKIDVEDFAKEVQSKVTNLELKDRVFVIAKCLKDRLPEDYPSAINILTKSLGLEMGRGDGMYDNKGHLLAPVARFVEEFGLDYPEVSLEALAEITKRHTAEFAIRPFVEKHYDITMKTVLKWAKSDNEHLRRAASEGIRPRLPWACQLPMFIDDPMPVLEVLELLRSDSSEYVRKSVGNNLNDISKDNRDIVLKTLNRWKVESPTNETGRIIKRAVRGLIKAGDPDALELIGATGGKDIDIVHFEIWPKVVKLGQPFKMLVELKNNSSNQHNVVMEYIVHHVKKSGKTNPKAFRLTSTSLKGNEVREISKNHSMKEITVRAYYPGIHKIEITINGIVKAWAEVTLVM